MYLLVKKKGPEGPFLVCYLLRSLRFFLLGRGGPVEGGRDSVGQHDAGLSGGVQAESYSALVSLFDGLFDCLLGSKLDFVGVDDGRFDVEHDVSPLG